VGNSENAELLLSRGCTPAFRCQRSGGPEEPSSRTKPWSPGRRSPVAFVKSTLALLERGTTADVETVKRRVQALITILEAEVRTRRLREGTRDVAEGEQPLVVSPPRHAPQSRPDCPGLPRPGRRSSRALKAIAVPRFAQARPTSSSSYTIRSGARPPRTRWRCGEPVPTWPARKLSRGMSHYGPWPTAASRKLWKKGSGVSSRWVGVWPRNEILALHVTELTHPVREPLPQHGGRARIHRDGDQPDLVDLALRLRRGGRRSEKRERESGDARTPCHRRSSPWSAFSAFSSQNHMSISRYIVVAVVRCSWAFVRSPIRRYSWPRPEVAVSDEGTHAELAAEGQRLTVVAFSLVGTARRRDVTGKARAWASLPRAPSRRVSAKASRAWLAASSIRRTGGRPSPRTEEPAPAGCEPDECGTPRRRPRPAGAPREPGRPGGVGGAEGRGEHRCPDDEPPRAAELEAPPAVAKENRLATSDGLRAHDARSFVKTHHGPTLGHTGSVCTYPGGSGHGAVEVRRRGRSGPDRV